MPRAIRVAIALFLLFAFASAQKVGIINEDDWRLPKDIQIQHYQLALSLSENDPIFKANLKINFTPVKKIATRLVLNAKNLAIQNELLNITNSEGYVVPIKKIFIDEVLERLTIIPQEPFQPNLEYVAAFSYKGTVGQEGVGVYLFNYTDGDGPQTGMATQLRPVHARRMMPCLDEPAFRASVSLTLIHDASYKSISNTPMISSQKLKNGNVAVFFTKTPPIPVFLIAFVISRFPEVHGKRGFSGLATPYNFPGIEYSAELGPPMARSGEEVTGVTYPNEITQQVALPDFIPVGMENWGLYNYQEKNILYFPKTSPTSQKQTVARFSGHEIFHAWMGNLVSLGWWDYLWMSEVFAMYYEYLLAHYVHPDWRMEEQMIIDLQHVGLLDDSLPVEPLTTRVLTPEQIENKFSGVTYTKGPGLLRMAIHFLGEETFLQGLNKLLRELAFSSIPNPDVLWNYLGNNSTELPAPIDKIMHDWTTESGYPVLNVATLPDRIAIAQCEFSLTDSFNASKTWWIPLSYTTKSEADFKRTKPKYWFPKAQISDIPEVISKEDWVLFNVQSSGFYRVNYDLANWGKLTDQLIRHHQGIPPINRAQLVDDSFNLARGGKLPYEVALGLAEYMKYERDFIPWRDTIRVLTFLNEILMNTKVKVLLESYIQNLAGDAFDAIGWDEKSSDSHTDRVFREEIAQLACQAGYAPCVARSRAYLQDLISGQNPSVSVDVQDTAICTGLRSSRPQAWLQVLRFYQSARDPMQKSFLLRGLSCPPSQFQLERFLADLLVSSNSDTWQPLVTSLATKKENADSLLRLFYNNKLPIEQKIGRSSFQSILNSIGPFLTTEKQEVLLSDLERYGLGKLEKLKEGVQNKARWIRKYSFQIETYLKKKSYGQSLIFSNKK